MAEPSFWSGLAKWDWLTLAGIVLVFLGVLGEAAIGYFNLRKPSDPYAKYSSNDPTPIPADLFFARAAWGAKDAKRIKNWHFIETLCGVLVAIGLLFEMMGFVPSLKEAWLEREALRLKAIRAEKELVSLKTTVQWRDITDAQETNLITRLKPVAQGSPRPLVRVSVLGDNPETRVFADKIIRVLLRCGFEVVPSAAMNIGTRTGEGIELDIKNLEAAPLYIVSILQAFREISPTTLRANDRLPENVLEIWVLHRPRPDP